MPRLRSWLASLALLLVLAAFGLARAEGGLVFYWVDAKGDLHATDRLADVPEPYYAMYAAKLRELEEARKQGKAPARKSTPPTATTPATSTEKTPSIVDATIARRQYWKALVAQWRKELESATAALRDATTAVEQAELNPILRETPEQQAVIAKAKEHQEAALARVDKAKKMLLEEIPKRARAEQVPPKWLD